MHEHDQEHTHDPVHSEGHDHEHHHHAPAADNAGEGVLKDPVCGMTVTPASPHHLEHDRATYYFCSVKCLGKFRLDPARYLAPPPSVPAAPVEAGTEYTCPMHPEIRQFGPGTAPNAAWRWSRCFLIWKKRKTRNWSISAAGSGAACP